MLPLVNYYEKTSPTGDFTEIIDREVIIISLRNIITTPKNSRVFLPNFGTSLYKYLFDPLDLDTIADLRADIIEQIELWEDRVTVHDVKLEQDLDMNAILVTITFSFKNETIEYPIRITPNVYESVMFDVDLPYFKKR